MATQWQVEGTLGRTGTGYFVTISLKGTDLSVTIPLDEVDELIDDLNTVKEDLNEMIDEELA